MRFLVATVTALVLNGCSPSRLPTTPDPAAPTPAPPSSAATDGWIWAIAVGKSGGCIESATFEVVSGQGALGTVITQQTPCSVWDYEGGVMFEDLTPTIPSADVGTDTLFGCRITSG